jgi:putative membrane protein
LVKRFRAGDNRYSGVFYRWFNEFPALILIAVVLLAVVRPY